jgi:hypothetical protein
LISYCNNVVHVGLSHVSERAAACPGERALLTSSKPRFAQIQPHDSCAEVCRVFQTKCCGAGHCLAHTGPGISVTETNSRHLIHGARFGFPLSKRPFSNTRVGNSRELTSVQMTQCIGKRRDSLWSMVSSVQIGYNSLTRLSAPPEAQATTRQFQVTQPDPTRA